MNKFKKFTLIATMAVAFGGAGSVFAQDTTTSPDDSLLAAPCPAPIDRAEAIAEILGITVEDLRSARAEGKTIRELAEELGVDLSEIERPFPQCPPNGERLENIAERLGITVEELVAELESGKTIRELAEELGVDLPDPRAEAKERIAEALGITVEDLQAALDSGKTVRELAAELGVELPNPREEAKARIAEALGMTVEELEAAIAGGATLRELAEQAGVELRDLRPFFPRDGQPHNPGRPGGRGGRGGNNG